MNILGQERRVLVADDEDDVRLYLKKYLERRGFKVYLAKDGSEAKGLIEKMLFDFFLLDCSMPDITGLELIQLARRFSPKSKIVLISAVPSVNDDVVKRLGGDNFIHKPLQLSELDGII